MGENFPFGLNDRLHDPALLPATRSLFTSTGFLDADNGAIHTEGRLKTLDRLFSEANANNLPRRSQ